MSGWVPRPMIPGRMVLFMSVQGLFLLLDFLTLEVGWGESVWVGDERLCMSWGIPMWDDGGACLVLGC